MALPSDVLWLRLSRRSDDPETALGNLNFGRMIVMINRKDYFQCGYIIRKGSLETHIKPAGLEAFRHDLATLVAFLGIPGPDGKSRADEIQSWDQVSLLPVQVNRLRRWCLPGMLCIGDAAHAMSPVGGIDINLAIQDAVAAARILGPILRTTHAGDLAVSESLLARVQRRRELPTRITQTFQTTVHGFLDRYLGRPGPLTAPLTAPRAQPQPAFPSSDSPLHRPGSASRTHPFCVLTPGSAHAETQGFKLRPLAWNLIPAICAGTGRTERQHENSRMRAR